MNNNDVFTQKNDAAGFFPSTSFTVYNLLTIFFSLFQQLKVILILFAFFFFAFTAEIRGLNFWIVQ